MSSPNGVVIFDNFCLMLIRACCESCLSILFPTGYLMPLYPTLLWCGVDLVGQALVLYRNY
jgi:hypothetical protein